MNRSNGAWLCAFVLLLLTASETRPRQVGGATAQDRAVVEPHRGQLITKGERRSAIDASSGKIPVQVTAVKNLDSDDWLKDMEFEVENRSGRPIYYLRLKIFFPDVPKTTEQDGTPRGLVTTVQYGRNEFLYTQELAGPGDVAIRPAQRVALRIEPKYYLGVKAHLRSHSLPESTIRRLLVRVDRLSFGDGSGYRVGGFPYSSQAANI